MPGQKKARIILVLHAHLPYIRIPDKKFPLQELWLYQAITESYIPLILCFRDLIEKKINFNITLSLSPVLLYMLSDDYYKTKYQDYLSTILKLLERKSSESPGEDQKHAILSLLNKIQNISDFYFKINGDIINELKKLSLSGSITLITTSATHALLPLFRFSRNIIKTLIEMGQAAFENSFGFVPEGFWLPEMGYFTKLDDILREFNIKYTFLEAHSVYLTKTRPSYGNYYPSITKSGLKIFPRDLALSNAIWSSKTGYPGDYRYREFHYDFTFSLSESELQEFGIERIPFGLKIYRITGNERPKEYYDYKEAMSVIESHSDNFIYRIRERTLAMQEHLDRTPVFTVPFDAELFGHWWYEGPDFLKKMIIKISEMEDIELIMPVEIEDEKLKLAEPAESSWGREGFFKSWTNPECTWIYPELAHLIVRYNNIQNSNHKASLAALKEILLASSSDWTFLIANNTSGDYGKFRLNDHINSAKKILNDIENGMTDESFLSERERIYPLFKDILPTNLP